MKNKITILLCLLLLFSGCRQSDYYLDIGSNTISDDGLGTGTVTWKKDQKILIEGLVFVNDGQVLTIEAGAVIRFRPGQAENASALIIARGGKIIAEGTPDAPIIFTAENDDLNGSVEKNARGLWGGLIILGNAPINLSGGETNIEGIPVYEERGIYGGSDINDNSGILRYVSIRHGGTNIGEGNEINGLTLGGIGSNTTVEFVEIYSNADDGIEIFGGTVNLRNMVVSGCGDDAFDYDLGWSGNGQFWLGVENSFIGNNLIEAGGGSNPVIGLPNSLPKIYNITLVGNGNTGVGATALFERYAGGLIANSIFQNSTDGIILNVTDQNNDSFSQWKSGKLDIRNNLFYQVAGSGNQPIFKLTGVFTDEMAAEWANYFQVGQNESGNPNINPEEGDFVPNPKVKGNLYAYPSAWFQRVDFKGAFGEDNWIADWTLLANRQ
jgi:hypothetical protein